MDVISALRARLPARFRRQPGDDEDQEQQKDESEEDDSGTQTDGDESAETPTSMEGEDSEGDESETAEPQAAEADAEMTVAPGTSIRSQPINAASPRNKSTAVIILPRTWCKSAKWVRLPPASAFISHTSSPWAPLNAKSAGWTISIMNPEGTMVLAAAGDGFAVVGLGACVPKP